MTGNRHMPLNGHLNQERACPLSHEAMALLPYSFIALDKEGTVLRVENPVVKGSEGVEERVVGRHFFTDLLHPPHSDRVGSRYGAMVRGESDNRFLEAIRFNLGSRERHVELIFSYYASAGLGYVLFREAP